MREAARYAVAQGMEIAGGNDTMDAIVLDEVGKLVQPDRTAQGYGEAIPSMLGEPAPQEAGDDGVAPEDLFDSTKRGHGTGSMVLTRFPPISARSSAESMRRGAGFQLADGEWIAACGAGHLEIPFLGVGTL